jgi:hypothetical protein
MGGGKSVCIFSDPKKLQNTEINYYPVTDMTTSKYFASVICCGMEERL